jgi:arylsulfatase A-like enzyme
MYGGYERISDDRTLISELLNDAGYRTGGFHSNLFLSSETGYSKGFDQFYDSRRDPNLAYGLRKVVRENLDRDGTLYQLLKWAFDKTEKRAGIELGSLYTRADDLTDMAIEWLEGTKSKYPTFAWVHYMDVHHPYVPPQEHQEPFRNEPISERHAVKLRRKMLDDSESLRESELSDIFDLYDAEIRFTDSQVQRLVHSADRYLDDPLIVFTSDHGEEFGEHGTYGHGRLHEECVHVPLIIKNNRRKGTHAELVGLLDIAPTLADYADCSFPQSFRGYSLKKLIEKDEANWEREYVISEYGEVELEHYHSYRDDDWTYIKDEEGERFYDRSIDPEEKNDILNKEMYATDSAREEIAKHKQSLKNTRTEVDRLDMDDDVLDRLEDLGYRME